MKITVVTAHRVRIPLRLQFAQANSRSVRSDSILLRISTRRGTNGWGESCPRTYVTGEDWDSVLRELTDWLPAIQAQDFSRWEAIRDFVLAGLDAGRGPAAVCALELALLDAWSREYERPLTDIFPDRGAAPIRYSGVVPFGNEAELTAVLSRFSFAAVKIKVGKDRADNLARIALIRRLQPSARIRVDANHAWSELEAAEHLPALSEAGVESCEQPLHPRADEASARLTVRFGDHIPILADESLTSYQRARELVAAKACNHFNIKLSKLGGLFNSLRVYAYGREQGVPSQLGAHFGETALLARAGRLFSRTVAELSACEGSFGTHLLREDPFDASFRIDARGFLPAAIPAPDFGWGCQAAPGAIAAYQSGGYILSGRSAPQPDTQLC